MKSAGTRPYRMTARAEAAEQTGERILDAVTGLFWERPTDQVVLADVAERADVTVQTVLRRFGSREGLLEAAAERAYARTRVERTAPAGDLHTDLQVLLDHYEDHGAGVLRLLAAESSSPALARYAEGGRRLHREWCATTFAAALAQLSGGDRRRRLAQLVAVCDVYTWKLLRHDAGLSRRQTHLALVELLGPLLHTGEPN